MLLFNQEKRLRKRFIGQENEIKTEGEKNMKFKNILAGVLIAASALSMTACGAGSSSAGGSGSATPAPSATAAASEVQDKVIKVATTSDPASLGTYDEGSSSGRWITLTFTYETLVYIDNDGQFKGILAKDWAKNEELSKDGKSVYDVEIYDYITDTAGNHRCHLLLQ